MAAYTYFNLSNTITKGDLAALDTHRDFYYDPSPSSPYTGVLDALNYIRDVLGLDELAMPNDGSDYGPFQPHILHDGSNYIKIKAAIDETRTEAGLSGFDWTGWKAGRVCETNAGLLVASLGQYTRVVAEDNITATNYLYTSTSAEPSAPGAPSEGLPDIQYQTDTSGTLTVPGSSGGSVAGPQNGLKFYNLVEDGGGTYDSGDSPTLRYYWLPATGLRFYAPYDDPENPPSAYKSVNLRTINVTPEAHDSSAIVFPSGSVSVSTSGFGDSYGDIEWTLDCDGVTRAVEEGNFSQTVALGGELSSPYTYQYYVSTYPTTFATWTPSLTFGTTQRTRTWSRADPGDPWDLDADDTVGDTKTPTNIGHYSSTVTGTIYVWTVKDSI